ncbi:hypothetical protein COU12_00435 [Candidatus Jorgensenbacteria bacterium CG10_big_fil_rev_8_21_14_0_10_54_38]|uniref:DEAD-box RNA helicase Q domain-containing protein n=2 Tax=Candidatus Joergenseniibacteriota TaxID=1752739 RepID=A0A2M6WGN1_9BACT|nr:MAG: hypothetical protein COX26_00565 [Candidatus Jorgensenbacteria bacterium CG23_combo_of_CG06-09_8_20_14_all_54_14]PIT91935.1 MAG: hypothetical protein COU12_00435 [Candidatus Jorgensenbacteria bacterium CG10_big_fil_rev_8_21_14_0_10_54_38]
MVLPINQSSGFYRLGIAPNILAVLDKLDFTVPTTIQEKSTLLGLPIWFGVAHYPEFIEGLC